ncbi:MAG: ATP-dependent protease ATPase subunit HslU [Dehalococcoidia bacterium]|nr:MAG: ATP-dependent protease ATPase subunit HslU [Dehalococcoidia bacterium]
MKNLTPQSVVAELDRYIVGQTEAKRAMAIALRNRYRRQQLPPEIAREIAPKNLLLIGPTGVGKTELARRVAALADAPFVKVEATKFTEVGYVGKDVDSIVHDLVEASVQLVHEEKLKEVEARAETQATEKILNYLVQQLPVTARKVAAKRSSGGAQAAADVAETPAAPPRPRPITRADKARLHRERDRLRSMLQSKQLEDQIIEIEVGGEVDRFESMLEFGGANPEEMSDAYSDFLESYHGVGGSRRRSRRVSVKEARRILTREEATKLIDMENVIETAVQRAESSGVVFIDELDKVAGPRHEIGSDVSGEGVQRDLLPIVEGTTVTTRYGPIKTDHVLFVAAGSFYQNKPSDLIPELQGRFPLRVELKSLTEEDFRRILTEPENALTKQYIALLGTEGVTITFGDDAIAEIARVAVLMNERLENIGARRLHTIMERVLEEISFSAPERAGETIHIDAEFVRERMAELIKDQDLSRYIL